MQYDIIMNLDFYVFQNILDHYSQIIEERRKEDEKQMKESGYDDKKYTPENMMKQAQKNMPMPKVPSIQIPKY